MNRTVAAIDRNTEAFGGIQSFQPGLALMGLVSGQKMLPLEIVQQATFSGCLCAAAMYSGKDDQTLATEIHISQGYISRAMRGVWENWAKRLVAFMRATNSIAPLQWIAEQVGCDVHPRAAVEREKAELRARLRALGDAA
jgi:hypothetical protein